LGKQKLRTSTIDTVDVDYSTTATFNLAAVVIVAMVAALYAVFW
jgi:SSS family solute:Na+ symporter